MFRIQTFEYWFPSSHIAPVQHNTQAGSRQESVLALYTTTVVITRQHQHFYGAILPFHCLSCKDVILLHPFWCIHSVCLCLSLPSSGTSAQLAFNILTLANSEYKKQRIALETVLVTALKCQYTANFRAFIRLAPIHHQEFKNSDQWNIFTGHDANAPECLCNYCGPGCYEGHITDPILCGTGQTVLLP